MQKMYITIFLRPQWFKCTWHRNLYFPTQLRSTFQGDLNAPVSKSVSQSVFHSSDHWTEIRESVLTWKIMTHVSLRRTQTLSCTLQTDSEARGQTLLRSHSWKNWVWQPIIQHACACEGTAEPSQHTPSSSFTPLIDSYIWMQVEILIQNQFHYFQILELNNFHDVVDGSELKHSGRHRLCSTRST